MKFKNKTLLITSLLAISTYSFADIKECALASANQNDEAIIKYCTPYLKDSKNPEATAILAGASKDDNKSLDYSLWYMKNFDSSNAQKSSNEKATYASASNIVGNIYYFGEAGKLDKTKGLEYITKAAELGNDFAQNQLGDFYNSQGGTPDLNISQTYKWYTLSKANGRSLNFSDFADNLKNQAPYCLAMGEQLVANAYIDGSAGLSQDSSKAKKYLSDAIALYKDNEPTKENLKYCPQQKGLDLDSAEKQLKSL